MLACLTQVLCDGFVKYNEDIQPIYTQVADNDFVTYIKCENYTVLTCEGNYGDSVYAASQDDSILNDQIESSCSSGSIKSSSDVWDGYYSLPSCPYQISEFEGQYAFHFYYYDQAEEQEQQQQVYIGEDIQDTELNKWFYQLSMVEEAREITVGDNTRYLIQPTNEQDIKCGMDYSGMNAEPYECSLVVFTPEEEGQEEEEQQEQEETSDDKPTKQPNSYENFFFATSIMFWIAFLLIVATFILVVISISNCGCCCNSVKNIFQ